MKRLIFIILIFIAFRCDCNNSSTPPSPETGSLGLTITSDFGEIEMVLTGAVAKLPEGEDMNLTVSSDTEDVCFYWYLNGVFIQTGESCATGSKLKKGVYALDVIGEKEKRGGSIHHYFEVVE